MISTNINRQEHKNTNNYETTCLQTCPKNKQINTTNKTNYKTTKLGGGDLLFTINLDGGSISLLVNKRKTTFGNRKIK